MRNGAQNVFSVAYGRSTYEDWFGANSNSALGTYSLKGNAAAIFITGSPRTGDVIPIVFTDPNLSGGVTTINYTVQSSDTTNAILATSIAQSITIAGINATLADNISADSDSARNPGVIAITHSGNSTIAGGNSGTMTVTVGTITPAGSMEILTVTNGATGSANSMVGAYSGNCLGCSTATSNNGMGNGVLTFMTTALNNNCDGVGSCTITVGHDNNVMGANALSNVVGGVALNGGASNNEIIGSKCGNTLVADTGSHGTQNIIIGDCQVGGGYITTGAANLEMGVGAQVPIITGSFGMSIMNALYGVNNSSSGATVSTGCIGVYFKCSTAIPFDIAVATRAQTSLQIGGGPSIFATLVPGELGWVKQSAPGAGPASGVAGEIYTCGATAGTLRKIVYSGSSAVPNIMADNIGSGNLACSSTTTPPTITAGTATLDTNATDLSGVVTEGSAQTGFTLAWGGGVTKNTTPHCIVVSPNGTPFTSFTVSATTLTVAHPSATGDVFAYSCQQ